MNADDMMAYSEPLLACQRHLARTIEQASVGHFNKAREHVAKAAEYLVTLETALNAIEARQRMRSEVTLIQRHCVLPGERAA